MPSTCPWNPFYLFIIFYLFIFLIFIRPTFGRERYVFSVKKRTIDQNWRSDRVDIPPPILSFFPSFSLPDVLLIPPTSFGGNAMTGRTAFIRWSEFFRLSLSHRRFVHRPRFHLIITLIASRPRWSRGKVLASRSKVRGFKPGWGRWIFSGRKNPKHKSSGRDFKLGVPSLRFQAR